MEKAKLTEQGKILLCEPSDFPDIIWSSLCIKGYSGVYLNFGLCENNLICTDMDYLIDELRKIKNVKLETLFSIPPMHERNSVFLTACIEKLLKSKCIDILIVNDIGSLINIRRHFSWEGKILFGRLFDKTVREARYSYAETNLSSKSISVGFNKSMYKLANQYLISGIVMDTDPDGILDLQSVDNAFRIYLLYPRIFLSKAAICEFSGYYKDIDEKFVFDTMCGKPCLKFTKNITAMHHIKKEGIIVYCTQTKPIQECAVGKYTIVDTRENWHECDSAYKK